MKARWVLGGYALLSVACSSPPATLPRKVTTPATQSSAPPAPLPTPGPSTAAHTEQPALAAEQAPVEAAPTPECPHVMASTAFEKVDWLGVYAKIVGTEGSAWGVPSEPTTVHEARRASCWESSGSSQVPPKRSKACDGTTPWRVTTNHHFYTDDTFFVWPLAGERAVVYSTILGGSACSMEQPSSLTSAETRRDHDFFVVEEEMQNYAWVAERSECVAATLNRTLELYDLTLERGFRIEGLSAEVTAELVPSEHAVVIRGGVCEQRVELSSVR